MTEQTAGRVAPDSRPVADACSLVYDREGWRAYLRRFIDPAPEYLSVFASAFCKFFGAPLEEYRRIVRESPIDAIEALVCAPERMDVVQTLRDRRRSGVTLEFLMGSAETLPSGETVNESLLRAVDGEPGVDVWAGVPLDDASRALAVIERAVAAGASGANVIPFLDRTPVTATHNTVVFGALEDAGLPVWIHAGHHFSARYQQGADSWRDIDDLARRHPRLVIIIGHAGWPQVLESTLVGARHQHVYLEFSSHRPRTFATEPEWRALIRAARGPLRHKILFGTSQWVNPQTIEELAAEVAALPIRDDVIQDWLEGNAHRLRETLSVQH